MNSLRLVLIIIGVLLIAAIYFFSRRGFKNTQKIALVSEKPDRRSEPVWDSQDEVGEGDLYSEDQAEMPDINLSMLSALVREAAKESGRDVRSSLSASSPKSTGVGKKENIAAKSERPSLLLNGNLLIIHLLAKDKTGFRGSDLLDIFKQNNIQFGNMQIFHYYSEESDQVLFSVVNIVKPGYFDLSKMDSFTTPGISFFMQLETLDYPLRAFELMLKTIWNIAEVVGARICDMNHSSLTPQTATFLHEEIRDFQNKTLRK